jgi:hypothetical protein
MIYTWQADCSALIRYSIVQEQMTSVHLDANAESIQNEDARFADLLQVVRIEVHQGKGPKTDEEYYTQNRVPCREAHDIRTGRHRPHPRHWQALAKLVGVSEGRVSN